MAKAKKRKKPHVEDGIYWEQWIGNRRIMSGHYDGEPPADPEARRDTRALHVSIPASAFRDLNRGEK